MSDSLGDRMKETVYISKIIVKEKYGYFVPARYRSTTYCQYMKESWTEAKRIPVNQFKTFKKCVEVIKTKFGVEFIYKVDEKPFYHTI